MLTRTLMAVILGLGFSSAACAAATLQTVVPHVSVNKGQGYQEVAAASAVSTGDQVMAALVLRPDATFDPVAFAEWVDGLADVGPKWRPRYVRIATNLPTTGTNKVVKRSLVHQKYRRDRVGDDPLFVRARGEAHYRPFGAGDEAVLREAMVRAGREQFWDL